MGTVSKQVLYKQFTSCIVIIYNTNSIQLHKRTQMNHLKNVLLSVLFSINRLLLGLFLDEVLLLEVMGLSLCQLSNPLLGTLLGFLSMFLSIYKIVP